MEAEIMNADGPIVHMPPVNAPLSLIERAIEKGVDAEQLGKLMSLYERMAEAKGAEAFSVAMNACQAAMPRVIRQKSNSQTNSKYAPLEDVLKTVAPIYTQHGFSLSFGEGEGKNDQCRLLCDVRHIGGHCQRYQGDFALDIAGIKGTVNKTGIQAKGSTMTYARRYLTCLIFNIAIGDEDDDGNSASGAITPEQVGELNTLIEQKHVDLKRFLAWAQIERLDLMPARDFPKALDMLRRKKANG